MSGPYKFLNREHLHFLFEAHTLVVSTPEHFANCYAAMETKNPQINDPFEARTVGIHDPIRNQDVSEVDREFYEEFGIKISGSVKNMTFTGNRVVRSANQCFIFSMAKGFFPDIKKALTCPPANYDACIRFSRPIEMWPKVLKYGRVGEKPMHELFRAVEYRKVQYEKILYKVGSEARREPHPFRKDTYFSDQNERRAVFYPLQPIIEQQLIITFDQLPDFISIKPL